MAYYRATPWWCRPAPPAAAQCRPCGNKCRPQALFGAALSVTLPPTGITAASWSIDLLPVCGVPPPGPAPAQLMAVLQWFDVQLSWANLDYIQRYKPLLPLIDPPLASANTGWRRFERQHSHRGAEKVKGCELSFEIDAGTDAK
ncbi:hypothetical protein C8R47DRAFT_1081166 [Mycena vitilis]|nr:hypothetical protein C8R47DRAFT_1084299 [Mycena vitilis]KAJ6459768.1 hypothetical protein C8R47DRAFT_1081166 [Mycena vitilis]